MWQQVKDKYWYVHSTFHDSSVIVFARVNVALGTAWVALQGVDVSPVLKDPKWMVYYVIFSNVVNELLRRSGATYDKDGGLK
jgi:hypothetical protein